MLKPGASVTISDYIHGVIKTYVKSLLLQYIRVDLLVDVYIPKSLKAPLRLTRGQGERKRVKLTTKVPKNFQSFLRVDEHKTELNGLITEELIEMDCPDGTSLIITKGNKVLSNQVMPSLDMISPSDHEEADTKGLLHARHMKIHGINSIMMRTCDTDQLVLAIAAQSFLQFDEFWLSFGVVWVEVINTFLSMI